ncbi:MAG: pyridoxamine 5'-phosphate oxidase family protein [Bacteroidota bacterium]
MELLTDLHTIQKEAWSWLQRGTVDRNSAFRWGTLATSFQGQAFTRVVISRKVFPGQGVIRFYTDARSAKMTHIQENPRVFWTFYDPRKQVQLRLWGDVQVHQQNTVTEELWRSLPDFSKKDYATFTAPGSLLDELSTGQLADAKAYEFFTVIETKVAGWEWLQLGRPQHRRATFSRVDSGDRVHWEGQWLVP